MTTATATPLVKDATFAPADVRIGATRVRATDRWFTEDGYVVYRIAPGRYWVREKCGKWELHSTLADARADIAWLRAHGR